MSQVVLRATIGASADEVWATISDFNGAPNYIGGLATSTMEGEGVGAVRTVTTKDGTQVQERLERFDPATYLLSYAIIAGPLPMANYVATMQLQAAGHGQCTLQWSSTFEPSGASEDDVKEIVEGIYNAGFKGLRRLHGEV